MSQKEQLVNIILSRGIFMKRFRIVIAAVSLAATLLSGCDGSNAKTPLLFGTIENKLVDLTYDDYVEKIVQKDNFLVMSTPNSLCTCWTTFRDSILMPYRKAHNLIIYTISYSQFFDDDFVKRDSYGLEFLISSQSLGIFKDGVIKENRPYNSTHKIWSSKDSFTTYMNELIIDPTIIEVNLSKLNTFYAQNLSFSILFYDGGAASSFLYDNVLTAYARANFTSVKKVFTLNTDVDGIKYSSGAFDEAQWQTFKDTYGLSQANNATFGYDEGVVPTIQYIEPDGSKKNQTVIKAQAVYLNDVLSSGTNPDTYEVTKSYYSSERVGSLSYLSNFSNEKVLVGKEISEADTTLIAEAVTWKYEKAAVYHDPLFNAFLDSCLPLTNYVLV